MTAASVYNLHMTHDPDGESPAARPIRIFYLFVQDLHDKERLMSDYRGEPLDEVLERFTQSSGRARDLAGDLHSNLNKAYSAVGYVAYKEATEEQESAAGN
jgi:hypothetical protein